MIHPPLAMLIWLVALLAFRAYRSFLGLLDHNGLLELLPVFPPPFLLVAWKEMVHTAPIMAGRDR
jgi:hypothetical protein